MRSRCVMGSGCGWMPSRGGARTPRVPVCPCCHCAGRQEPPQSHITTVLTVALSHCDGSGPPPGGGRRPSRRDPDGREPGIPADADGPARDTPKLRLSWHVSITVATPHCDGCNRTTASICPGRPGPRRQAGPQVTDSANSNVMGSSNPSLPYARDSHLPLAAAAELGGWHNIGSRCRKLATHLRS